MGITAAIVGAVAAIGSGTASAVMAHNAAQDQKKAAADQAAQQQALIAKQKSDADLIKKKTLERDQEEAKFEGVAAKNDGKQGTISPTSLGLPGGGTQSGTSTAGPNAANFAKSLLGL